MSDRLAQVEGRLRSLDYHLAEIERRLANTIRMGTVKEVDAQAGKARVEIAKNAEGQPVLTPLLKWSEHAGKIKTWIPLVEGEQVMVVAPSGDLAQGWIVPGGFSDANPSPSQDGEEAVVTLGQVRVTLREDQVKAAIGEDVEIEARPQYVRSRRREARSVVSDRHAKLRLGEHYLLVADEAPFVRWSIDAVVADDPQPEL